MAIDFLGKPKPIKKRIGSEVKYHIPEKEKVQKAESIIKKEISVVKNIEPVSKSSEELGEANLIKTFKENIRKKRLFTLLFILGIFWVVIFGAYFLYNYLTNLPPAPSIVINQPPVNIEPNVNIEPIVNNNTNIVPSPPPLPLKYSCNAASGQCTTDADGLFATLSDCQSNCFAPPPLPVCGNGICETNENSENCLSDCPPIILPDTELSPLRGTLVQFPLDSNIYLIENNGELRNIEKETVIFKNGQNIYQLKTNLIYTLSSRFVNTRRGKDVKGFIDWDPRVLAEDELALFIK